MEIEDMPHGIWAFQDPGNGRCASGLFTSESQAEEWISKHGLSGTLTLYPVDVGVYEWAIERGLFSPKKPHESEAAFIGNFTTASQPHHHYENGRRDT